MSDSDANDFVAFLKEEAGEYLRSVIYFDGTDHELAYVRDDVREEYSDRDHERVVESLLAETAARNEEEELYVHGQLNCIVRSFEHAVELHFPKGTYSGTAVALDPDAARDLSGLIASVIERTAFDEPLSDDEAG